MENPYRSDNPFVTVFGPLAWPQTYGRLFYLLLGLPLGVAYFTYLVTGLALGVGLAILLVGFAILLAVVLVAVPLGLFERWLAIHLIGEPVPSPGYRVPDENVVEWLKTTVGNRVTWTSLLFLAIKFPLGLATWIATIVALSVSIGFTFAPVVLWLGGEVQLGFWSPATPVDALALVPVGLAMIVLSFHLVNGMGWAWGKLARVMLGRGAEAAVSPHTGAVRESAPASAPPRLTPGTDSAF